MKHESGRRRIRIKQENREFLEENIRNNDTVEKGEDFCDNSLLSVPQYFTN